MEIATALLLFTDFVIDSCNTFGVTFGVFYSALLKYADDTNSSFMSARQGDLPIKQSLGKIQ